MTFRVQDSSRKKDEIILFDIVTFFCDLKIIFSFLHSTFALQLGSGDILLLLHFPKFIFRITLCFYNVPVIIALRLIMNN